MATLKNDWNGNIYLNGSKTNSRGVAILISNSLEYKVTHTEMDAVGIHAVIRYNCVQYKD